MAASFKLGEQDVIADLLVFWKDTCTVEGNEIDITEIAMTSAVVDGSELSDEELADFRRKHEASYTETLEWIALSSIDSSVTLPS